MYQVVDYELEDLSRQCLIFDDCGQPYHHYNFTMKSKRPNSDLESSTNVESCISRHYFAEVKLMDGEKHYFCCPLESFDNGIYNTYIYCISYIYVTQILYIWNL